MAPFRLLLAFLLPPGFSARGFHYPRVTGREPIVCAWRAQLSRLFRWKAPFRRAGYEATPQRCKDDGAGRGMMLMMMSLQSQVMRNAERPERRAGPGGAGFAGAACARKTMQTRPCVCGKRLQQTHGTRNLGSCTTPYLRTWGVCAGLMPVSGMINHAATASRYPCKDEQLGLYDAL